MCAPRLSLSRCFFSTPENSSLSVADVKKAWEKGGERVSPFGAGQLCNQFPPCPFETTHQAGHPHPVLSARKGWGLPQYPVAVEELQGTSLTQDLTACGGLPNLLHSPLCSVPLCVTQPCRQTAVTSEETQKAMAGPLAACYPACSWSS